MRKQVVAAFTEAFARENNCTEDSTASTWSSLAAGYEKSLAYCLFPCQQGLELQNQLMAWLFCMSKMQLSARTEARIRPSADLAGTAGCTSPQLPLQGDCIYAPLQMDQVPATGRIQPMSCRTSSPSLWPHTSFLGWTSWSVAFLSQKVAEGASFP